MTKRISFRISVVIAMVWVGSITTSCSPSKDVVSELLRSTIAAQLDSISTQSARATLIHNSYTQTSLSPLPTDTLIPTPSPLVGKKSLTIPNTETPTPKLVISCPHAPPSRVFMGGNARVIVSGTNLWVRSTPEVNDDNKITKLSNGTIFQVVGGPVCAPRPGREDEFLFWQASIPSTGITGWVAEGDLTQYYIEPVTD